MFISPCFKRKAQAYW